MRTTPLPVVAVVLCLAGCGGGASSAGVPATNAYTGTLAITSALPAGTTTCGALHEVTFTAATGASLHTVTAAGGECLSFTNSDTVDHQVTSLGPVCAEIDAVGRLTPGQTRDTLPLAGPKTCMWEDSLNPPGSGGGPGY